ncbi:phosphoribosylaminoimidazole synthetase [Actinobacillus pleuropneumoniae]|nr:phosphoribosylaminoimidazole synthetase [Actinobacillus pleuropneumoniae]
MLLAPTKIYVKPLLGLLKEIEVKGMAHITGGGFIENIPRMLPDGVNVDIEYGAWPILPIFKLMQDKGSISNKDMFTTFNMGIGMVLVVKEQDADGALQFLRSAGEEAYVIGRVTEGERIVTFTGAEV